MEIIRTSKENEEISATYVSHKDNHMDMAWIIEDNFDTISNTALDLAQTLARSMINEHEGTLKIHLDYKVVWEMLAANILKSSQSTMDIWPTIRKII